MSYLTKLPHDIYTLIYKYVYKDCMNELVKNAIDKRNVKYKEKFLNTIINGDMRLYYTSLEMFNMVSLGIIGKDENCEEYYEDGGGGDGDSGGDSGELEELYYLSAITDYNFRKNHYHILITAELPENFKNATCIKMKLTNIDTLLGFNEGFNNGDEDNIYIPLYYLLEDFLTTWLELIYYTNKLLNEYLAINNIVINVNFFPLYRFDTIIENGYKVIVPFFEEPIQQ